MDQEVTPDMKEAQKLLGLPTSYTSNDLRDAYARVLHEWHPDVAVANGHTKRQSEEMMIGVNAAYRLLMMSFNGKPSEYRIGNRADIDGNHVTAGNEPADRRIAHRVKTGDNHVTTGQTANVNEQPTIRQQRPAVVHQQQQQQQEPQQTAWDTQIDDDGDDMPKDKWRIPKLIWFGPSKWVRQTMTRKVLHSFIMLSFVFWLMELPSIIGTIDATDLLFNLGFLASEWCIGLPSRILIGFMHGIGHVMGAAASTMSQDNNNDDENGDG